MIGIGALFILLLVVFVFAGIALFVWGLKKALLLALNSVIGFFALYALKLVIPKLVINIWSILLTAILGIFGFLLVLILHAFGALF